MEQHVDAFSDYIFPVATQWRRHHPRYKLQYVRAMFVLVLLGKVHKCKVHVGMLIVPLCKVCCYDN